jgi:hypothetical protein
MIEVSDSYECDRGREACEDRNDKWKVCEAVDHEAQTCGRDVDETLPELGGPGSLFCVMHREPPDAVSWSGGATADYHLGGSEALCALLDEREVRRMRQRSDPPSPSRPFISRRLR